MFRYLGCCLSLVLLLTGCGTQSRSQPVVGKKPSMPTAVNVPFPKGYRVETIATGLNVPWDIAFPSRSRMYVTERPGRVRLIEDGKLRAKSYATIKSVSAEAEGGLMGIALHPDYPKPRYVYLMYTYRFRGKPYNRVSRFMDTGSGLKGEKILVGGIRGHLYHDGGAVRFGPDRMLYIGTGDAGQPDLAQKRDSLNGKILRMTPDGKAPTDNPFPGSLVYALGFRNVQGLAWNPSNGDLWATNHGPSGEFGLEARDSVFIVEKGGNYGWPKSLGVTNVRGVKPPVLFFPGSAVPPALAMFYSGGKMPNLRGDLFFATLRSEYLARVVLSGPRKISRLERWFATGRNRGRFGRLRVVVEGPDGAIYISTSNRDRRGRQHSGDDRIIRISR